MKTKYIYLLSLIFALFEFVGCSYPIDDDGLLITNRQECYVSSFDLLDVSHQTVCSSLAVVDTTECTIKVNVRYGTDLHHLWPRFSLCQDAKLDPKITTYCDFSDIDKPLKFSVISGDRKIRKTYSILISEDKVNQ